MRGVVTERALSCHVRRGQGCKTLAALLRRHLGVLIRTRRPTSAYRATHSVVSHPRHTEVRRAASGKSPLGLTTCTSLALNLGAFTSGRPARSIWLQQASTRQ